MCHFRSVFLPKEDRYWTYCPVGPRVCSDSEKKQDMVEVRMSVAFEDEVQLPVPCSKSQLCVP